MSLLHDRVFLLLLVIIANAQIIASATCSSFSNCTSCAQSTSPNCHYCLKSSTCLDQNSNGACRDVELISDGYDCPSPPQPSFAYVDAFARNLVLPLCAATYASNAQTCLDRIGNVQLKRQLVIHCDSSQKDTCSAYTAVKTDSRAIIIAFRGTSGDWQMVLEIAETLFKNKKPFVIGGNVDAYFSDAFYALWNNGLRDDFLTLRNQNPTYELWVVGHSLGAALATLCASLIVKLEMLPGERVKLVTMGEPRTGDIAFARAHDLLLPYSYRIIHRHDWIAHMPPKLPNNILDSPYHHRYEVWYNNDMTPGATYQLCTRPDDPQCSEAQINLSQNDHDHYFNQSVDCTD